MISNKAFREDKLAFKLEFQSASLSPCLPEHIFMYFCLKWGYLLRGLYRMMDVLYRLSVALLIWLFLSGFWIFLFVAIEVVVFVFLCWKTNELRFIHLFVFFFVTFFLSFFLFTRVFCSRVFCFYVFCGLFC